MTPGRFGVFSRLRASVELMMCLPSWGATGMSTGTEPTARITARLALSVVLLPSAALTSTRRPAWSWPRPLTQSMPLAAKSWAMPPVSWLTTPSLRAIMAATSSFRPLAPMPWLANSCWAFS